MTVASEMSSPTAAYVSEKMGLPGYKHETAKTILNKYLLRKKLHQKNINVPVFGIARDIKQGLEVLKKIGRKAIIKPLEASGSRGIFIIENEEQLIRNFETSKGLSLGEKGVVVETFVEGTEVGGECLVYQGKLAFFHLTKI
ncbi:MAG: acetyl-CoA carboxylase biotin carboxylase subunit family protein [Vulcanimicrobiota bacterium]